jgi:RNA polymerase sigma-70 factor, ECF subfamily
MDPAQPDFSQMYEACLRYHQGCEEFFCRLHPVFERIASRVAHQFGAAPDVDDVVQEINLKFVSSGPVILPLVPAEPAAALAYFSVVAANAARDFFRARNATKRGAQQTVSLTDSIMCVMPAAGLHSAVERNLLMTQIEECLRGTRRDQIVFRLYYRQGFTAKEIAAIPALDLTVKGVESLIHRIALQIRDRIQVTGDLFSEKGDSPLDASKQ